MGNKSVHCYLFTNYYRYKMYRIYVKKKTIIQMLFLNLEKNGHHVRVCFVLHNLT